jgi:hypothetical protein
VRVTAFGGFDTDTWESTGIDASPFDRLTDRVEG